MREEHLLGVSVKLWQSLLCQVSAIPVGQDTRVALPWKVRDHPLLLVLLPSLFREQIQQLDQGEDGEYSLSYTRTKAPHLSMEGEEVPICSPHTR